VRDKIRMIAPALFAELRDLCLHSFPERLDQRLSQIESITTGRHPALAFSLSWRKGVRPRVERLLLQRYADDWTWWVAQDGQKAQREWTVMRWLYGYGLPAPKTYALSDQGADSFLLLERLAGQAITLRPDERVASVHEPGHDSPVNRAAAARSRHVDALGALLAQLHRQSVPDSVREVLPRIDVQEQMEQIARIAQQQKDAALMEAIGELSPDQVEVYPPCVLHGDPQLASIKCDARGITAWLNWENSAIGDPRWDVASVINELQSSQRHSWADRFYETYSERAGIRLHNMAYWQALVAIQRWAITRQVYPDADAKDQSLLSRQLEPLKKQTWVALARLRDARTVSLQPET
jgi:aminoglycoside phosphotransferase (APT) family kinase protein